MAIANGPGKKIDGGGLSVMAYARIYAFAMPVLVDPNTGVPVANPGTFDARGQYLHILYEGNLNLGARSGGNQIPGGVQPVDFVSNKISVEFDVQSSFTVPFEGQISLIGGAGEWVFGLMVHDHTESRDYRPQLRTLSTFKRAGSTFIVPDYHTYILGLDPRTQFVLPTGDTLIPSTVLPGVNILPRTPLVVGARDTTVQTGWFG